MNAESAPLVLVVDDTPRNLQLAAEVLSRGGFEPALAPDGPLALAFAAREAPDLVLLDVLMPGMDGLEVCRRLKADPATRAIPVIFLTAVSGTEDIVRGFEAGGVDYVSKPFQGPELLARVRPHVALRRAAMEIQTLRGILPTCSHCKKIRDEAGAWHPIEAYISSRSEARFSHGMCPECLKVHFPEVLEGPSEARP